MDKYAADQMPGEEYVQANRTDCELERLIREKTKLATALRSQAMRTLFDASVRQFCAIAKARWYGRRQPQCEWIEAGFYVGDVLLETRSIRPAPRGASKPVGFEPLCTGTQSPWGVAAE
jgi:hypothetical protein